MKSATVIYLAILCAGLYGYVENILKLCRLPGIEGHMEEVVIRVIGIFTGVVGAIAGYF